MIKSLSSNVYSRQRTSAQSEGTPVHQTSQAKDITAKMSEALIFIDCSNDGKYCQVCALRNVWGNSRWAENSSDNHFVASLGAAIACREKVCNHFKETRLSIRIDEFLAIFE